jgi:hypothetical protein
VPERDGFGVRECETAGGFGSGFDGTEAESAGVSVSGREYEAAGGCARDYENGRRGRMERRRRFWKCGK